ncbi:MAG: hypothetical protein PUD07_05850 [bacterium]|nr:hypothetical protein [bacterium]
MKKTIYSLLVIFSLTLCVFFITESYAKYLTSTEGNAKMNVARWKIIVNNEDIKNNSSLTTQITPTFLGNDNIAENVIAPTSEGYFDLIIDATEADVSFKYNIDIEVDENSSVQDLKISKFVIDEEEIIPTDNTYSIERQVLHKDNTQIIKIRVYIYWDDSESASMDNTMDTQATIDNNALLNVNLNFTQLV